MSLVEEILEELWNTELNYRGMRVNFLGIPRFEQYNRGSLRVSLGRLHKKGFIEIEEAGWSLTASGREYVTNKMQSLQIFSFDFPKNSPKNLLVMFDIPESKKAGREWFRYHLKQAGFVMLQRSVWAGPSPLPKEFLEYLSQIKLKDCIKTFKLAKPYK